MSEHTEFLELTGVYALDALDDEERARMETHLADCGICRNEVNDLKETASLLIHANIEAPDSVWEGISQQINAKPEPKPLPRIAPLRSKKPIIATIIGVAAAFLIVVMVASNITQSRRIDKLQAELAQQSTEQQAAMAATQDGSKQFNLLSADKQKEAKVVVTKSGRAFLVGNDLPRLTEEKTYQAWAVVGDQKISVGILGNSPRVTAFHLPSDTVAVALTVEKSTGVVSSTQQPAVSGLVPNKTTQSS